MAIKRDDFWKWMNTCPTKEWFQSKDDGLGTSIYFLLDEDDELDELDEDDDEKEQK